MSQQKPTRHLRQRPVAPSNPTRPRVAPSTLRIVPAPSTRSRPTQSRNKFEAAALKIPKYLKVPDGFFPTDAELDADLEQIDALIAQESGQKRAARSTPYQREARRTLYHQSWDRIFTLANRDTMRIWGLKPQEGDLVHIVPIPDSGLAVRLWDSGLEDPSECCLDFIDSVSLKAVNSPEDWQLFPANQLGAGKAPILSREEIDGYRKSAIPLGEERFDIMRACCYAIRRPNCPDFLFEVPMKSIVGVVRAYESRAVG